MTYLFQCCLCQLRFKVRWQENCYYWTCTLTYAQISFSNDNRKPLLFPLLIFLFKNNTCAFPFNYLLEGVQFPLLKGSFKSFKVEKKLVLYLPRTALSLLHTPMSPSFSKPRTLEGFYLSRATLIWHKSRSRILWQALFSGHSIAIPLKELRQAMHNKSNNSAIISFVPFFLCVFCICIWRLWALTLISSKEPLTERSTSAPSQCEPTPAPLLSTAPPPSALCPPTCLCPT